MSKHRVFHGRTVPPLLDPVDSIRSLWFQTWRPRYVRYMQQADPTRPREPSERQSGPIDSKVAELRLLLIRTTGIAAETLQALLEERGALGSAIEQRRGTRLVRLQAYFTIEAEVPVAWVREKLAELHANGVPVGPAEIRLLPLRGENWAESWKQHFHAIQVTPRLIVAPTWEKVPDGAIDVIRLDPGMAFGLGDHPTTRGCLQMMERMSRPGTRNPTADVGCGTGILSIRAVHLGLGPVEAFDTEADAIRCAAENAERNGVANQIVFREGTMPAYGAGPYGRVLANLFLTVLEELMPRMARALEPRGEVLVAGILGEQEDRIVTGAAGVGLEVVDRVCERVQPGAKRWPVLLLRNRR
jgi:ribosomal protein L11 methyltransferase